MNKAGFSGHALKSTGTGEPQATLHSAANKQSCCRKRCYVIVILLLLAAALVVAACVVVPIADRKYRDCIKDLVRDGLIDPQAQADFYGYYNTGSNFQDPHLAKCDELRVDEKQPLWFGTVAFLAVCVALALALCHGWVVLVVALSLVAVDAVLWTITWCREPIGQKRFHDCMKAGVRSGEIAEGSEYDEYYKYGANPDDPWDEKGLSRDPGIARCQYKMANGMVSFIVGIVAFVIALVLFVFFTVLAIIALSRKCRSRTTQEPQYKTVAGLVATDHQNPYAIPVQAEGAKPDTASARSKEGAQMEHVAIRIHDER